VADETFHERRAIILLRWSNGGAATAVTIRVRDAWNLSLVISGSSPLPIG